jgi:hypothetical protein
VPRALRISQIPEWERWGASHVDRITRTRPALHVEATFRAVRHASTLLPAGHAALACHSLRCRALPSCSRAPSTHQQGQRPVTSARCKVGAGWRTVGSTDLACPPALSTLIRLYLPGLPGSPLSTCPSTSPADRALPLTPTPSEGLRDDSNAIPLTFAIECPVWHCRAENHYFVEKYSHPHTEP